ncbi:hypothetical protein NDU88_001090 [Pleurodeles waltl]|uniref:Uncharacterized protein n=1 Tax=Pleurodeles waltl TaxID=8319 RepID=A0AAV7P5Z9_PLEWA|nr:hypothetical protein NDU88_001090 [Pleurodeles waltl]
MEAGELEKRHDSEFRCEPTSVLQVFGNRERYRAMSGRSVCLDMSAKASLLVEVTGTRSALMAAEGAILSP